MPTPADTVLIIEDDPECREAMCRILEVEGHRVAVAEHGLAAMRYLEAHDPPGLIVLDLMLPVMDGWKFVAEQRSRPQLAAIPIVLVSGEYDLPKYKRDLAAVGYLRKPFDVDDLLSAVRLLLPRPKRPPRSPATPAAPISTRNAPALVGWRVLVVDDDPLVVEALTILLAHEGADIESAGSVDEAWGCMQRQLPDVVVSDLVLGDEDGATLIQRIRADASTRELHSIALTGHALPGERERAIAAGFDRYVTKPFDIDELRTHIAHGRRRG